MEVSASRLIAIFLLVLFITICVFCDISDDKRIAFANEDKIEVVVIGEITAESRVYNGDTLVFLVINDSLTLGGINHGDDVSLDINTTNYGYMHDANAGNDKNVITDFRLVGADAYKYIIIQRSDIFVDIAQASVVVVWSAGAYYYNGKAQSPIASIIGVDGQIITLPVTGKGVKVGQHTVSVTSSSAGSNYDVTGNMYFVYEIKKSSPDSKILAVLFASLFMLLLLSVALYIIYPKFRERINKMMPKSKKSSDPQERRGSEAFKGETSFIFDVITRAEYLTACVDEHMKKEGERFLDIAKKYLVDYNPIKEGHLYFDSTKHISRNGKTGKIVKAKPGKWLNGFIYIKAEVECE